ncbi:hypothetical protein AB4Z13_31340 [Rhizobium sp. YAF28]
MWVGIDKREINWILDADIRSFFDEIDHEWMLRFLSHRVGDRRLIRLIHKWLKAGTIEDGRRVASTRGIRAIEYLPALRIGFMGPAMAYSRPRPCLRRSRQTVTTILPEDFANGLRGYSPPFAFVLRFRADVHGG